MKLHQCYFDTVQKEHSTEQVLSLEDRATYVYEVSCYAPEYHANNEITVSTWDKAVGVALGWMAAHDVTQYSVFREDDHSGYVWDMRDKRTNYEVDKVGAQIFGHEVH